MTSIKKRNLEDAQQSEFFRVFISKLKVVSVITQDSFEWMSEWMNKDKRIKEQMNKWILNETVFS